MEKVHRLEQTDHKQETGSGGEFTCWKEMLDRALSGFESTDRTLERIIDGMERRP